MPEKSSNQARLQGQTARPLRAPQRQTTDNSPNQQRFFQVSEDGSISLANVSWKTDSNSPFSWSAREAGPATAPLPEPVWEDPARNLRLYESDSLIFLESLARDCGDKGKFDVIFADPPYFLSNGGMTCHSGKRVKVDKGAWDKSRGADLNHAFTLEWLRLCQKVLKPNGTVWVTGTQHVIFSVGFAMQQLGFKLLNTITWEKPNPPPNLSCRYFTHSTETLLWAARNARSKHCFNYKQMRDLNGGKQMKTVWKIAAPGAVEKTCGKHPTQKPVALIERCLLASSKPGDLVLDPFLGAGSTAVAAAKLGRGCVGIDLERAWVEVSARRLSDPS